MSNADEIRWRQRLDNFSNALDQLSAACGQPDYTDLERSGLVQTFEFSFELAWKTLQDLLFYEGYEAQSPRPVIRQSFVAGCLDENDCETLTKLAWHPLMGAAQQTLSLWCHGLRLGSASCLAIRQAPSLSTTLTQAVLTQGCPEQAGRTWHATNWFCRQNP